MFAGTGLRADVHTEEDTMRVLRTRIAAALSLGVAALGMTACTVVRDWQYPPDPPGALLNVAGSKTVPVNVAVLPLRDLRGANTTREGWKIALPFVPYGVNSFDRPETAQDPEGVSLIRMNPSRDFAHAIVAELKHANVFSTVSYADAAAAKPDIILVGTLRSTNWQRAYTTYGLGPVGSLFWLLGAPMGNTTNTVSLDLQIVPVAEPSRVLWQFTMQFEDRHLFGVYYGTERSVESYATALQEALRPAIASLAAIAAEHPELLRPGQGRGLQTAAP